ncbi:MAG TPA: aminotransferase class V-fold PLP-dependent enzyme [Chryseosolibacter sp.]
MLACKYSKFSLPASVTYLNCAYMSPLLKSVEKSGIRGIRMKRNPAGIHPQDFFTIPAKLREEFAKLVNVSDPSRIAIIPSVSYGMSTVSRNLRIGKGQHVLVAADQFPSNYYPWETVCAETGAELKVVSPEKGFKDRGKIWNQKFLESINPKTRVVAMANAHWTDGTRFDLEAIGKRAREVGALLVIDGTQSVGALPFDVRKIQPDALVCAGYKWLLGPYSLGLAYYGEYFNDAKPVEENWIHRLHSEDFSRLVSYDASYQPGATRFGMGEHSNFILAPMALNAIAQINRWGVANIQEYCSAIAEDSISKLREKGFLIEALPYRTAHLFGIRHSGQLDPDKLKEKLNKYKISVSVRGDAIRVSPHVYNDEQDLARLVKALVATIQ